jgi:hypothetical protein
VCAINNDIVSFIGAGSCVINANQGGDATYAAANQVQQVFNVNSAGGATAQTILFTSTAPANATAPGASYLVTAAASPSNLPVVLTIDPTASSVCTINNGVVSMVGAGTCTINANQGGNMTYAPALQKQQLFVVTGGSGSATQLVFTLQPANVLAGHTLNTIAVTQKNAVGGVVTTPGNVVLTVPGCGSNISLGSVAMVNGVATLSVSPRFYTLATGKQISASSGTLSALSSTFDVVVNPDLIFSGDFDLCRL